VRWYPPGAERQRAGDHINFFSPSHRRGVSSVRLRDYNFEMPKVFANTKEQDSARTKSNAVFNHYPGRYTTEGDGDKMAQLVLEAQNAGNQTAVAAGTACGLRVGGRFSLENPRDVGHDGTELAIVETSHDISLDSYRSSSGGGSEHVATVSLKAIPVSVPFRLPLSTPKPTILGPQTAVVTSGGGEIDVDEHGRILVRFHWDYAKRYDNGRASCRIRVAQSFAGGGWGAVFLPRAGQEVIVEFLNGDPDHPIVTGAVYNGEKKPPYDLPANKTRTVIKTDSSEGGGGTNELRLEDKKGREEVYLQAEKDMNTLVKNDETLTVGNNRTKTIQRGNETIKIEKGNRDTELGMGNDTLTLKMGNQETKISLGKSSTEALQSIELKVGANSIKVDQSGVTIKGLMVKIEGTAMLDVKAPVAMVKGDGMLKLNGGITMIN